MRTNDYSASCCGVSQKVHVPWTAYGDPNFKLHPGEFPGPAIGAAPHAEA